MRFDSTLCAAIRTLGIIVLIGILVSIPSSLYASGTGGIRENNVNPLNPSSLSPASLPNQLAISSSASSAQSVGHVEHPQQGLLPISSTSPQVSSSIPIANYDEQLGTTFTQSFMSIAYNVTAVAQSDTYGYGPAYLLNGLGSTGYWYQIGISYDWPLTVGGYNPGFGMNYEVFDSQGVSIFPSSGGGGLSSIQVNPGDTILLSLNFSASGRNVVMMAKDWSTGSTNFTVFSAERATSFIGLTNNFEQNGFFTGLMTEWYHVDSYQGNEEEVVYSANRIALSSAWMWMDEFNVAGGLVFRDATTSPVALSSNPSQLQPFYSNGAYEAVDSYEFVTGFQPPPVQVSRPIPNPATADVGQPVSFTCGASGGVPPFSYSWSFGDGSSATGQNVSHAFSSPGIMNVQCTAFDSLQTTSENTTSIMVLSDPLISLQLVNPTSVDIGQVVTFTVRAIGGSGVYSYKWTHLPIGCTSIDAASIPCRPETTGTFPVAANVTDSNGFSVIGDILPVTVYPDPLLTSFTASSNNLDIGQTITFAASASGGAGDISFVYYSLPTGCESANSTSLSCTPATTGTFHVILTVTDSNGFTVSSSRIIITVNADPTATIAASPPSIDIGQSLTFTVLARQGTGPFSYSYETLPTGCTTSNSPNLFCAPSSIGNYTIKVVVSDRTGEKSTAYLSVAVNPVVGISAFTTSLESVNAGKEFTLTVLTTGGTSPLSYSYLGLPRGCSPDNSPVLHCTPSAGGPYLIQATVTDKAGKSATSSVRVTVIPAMVTGFPSNQEYLLIGGVVIALVAGTIALVLLRRREREPNSSESKERT